MSSGRTMCAKFGFGAVLVGSGTVGMEPICTTHWSPTFTTVAAPTCIVGEVTGEVASVVVCNVALTRVVGEVDVVAFATVDADVVVASTVVDEAGE